MAWKVGNAASLQNPLRILYPDQCLSCGSLVEGNAALCPECWSDTPFAGGLACDACSVPLIGDTAEGRPLCDDCLESHPPWLRARTVMTYRGRARRLVLALKHGDRLDLVRPAAAWMALHGRDLLAENALLVPVPLHWTRLLRRRFNQAALLSNGIAQISGCSALPDGLLRTRRTQPQEKMSKAERTENLAGAFRVNPARSEALAGASVVLVDDVMTSGATLAECSRVLRGANVTSVSVLTLARVAKDP